MKASMLSLLLSVLVLLLILLFNTSRHYLRNSTLARNNFPRACVKITRASGISQRQGSEAVRSEGVQKKSEGGIK